MRTKEPFDLAIKNGRIVDGTGNPWFKANIGVKDGVVAEITRSEDIKADRVIDAKGLVLAPGFIDIHSHTDFSILTNNRARNRIMQGITTDVVGNCGQSAYAFTREIRGKVSDWLSMIAGREVEVDWHTLTQWRRKLEKIGVGVNIVPFVGFGTVRRSVMGDEGEGGERNDPEASELDEMKALVEGAMNEGAFGLSTGLEYAPQRNAYTEEVIELCKVASNHNGVYMSHIRSEDDYVVDAVKEAIRISREANIPGCISHHKACSSKVWGKPRETLKLMNDARKMGVEIMCDTYPWLYVAVRNVGLFFLKPGESLEEKRGELLRYLRNSEAWLKIKSDVKSSFENEQRFIDGTRRRLKKRGTPGRIAWNPVTYYPITYSKKHHELEGKNFTEATKVLTIEDPWDAMREVYLADDGSTRVAMGSMSEKDLVAILRAPFTAISTDAGAEDEPKSFHPRGYGTYPQVFEKYVRNEPVLSLEEAVRKMTSLQANFLNLKGRGLIKEGYWADITVFDPESIRNRATFAEPSLSPEGISYLMVNGKLTIDEGRYVDSLSGRVLTRDK